MSDPGKSPGYPPTMPGMIAQIGNALISSLPPAFLILVAMNIAFLGMLLWFIDGQRRAVAGLMDRVLTACMADLADTKIQRTPLPRIDRE